MDLNKTSEPLGIPEVFYDTLAYVIPAAYLVFGILVAAPSILGSFAEFTQDISSWVIETLLVMLIFGGMFIVGQMLTVISFYFVWYWPYKITRKYESIQKDYIKIKVTYPSMSLLITKRFAKCVCSRNMVLSSVILAFYHMMEGNTKIAIVAFALAVVFLIDTHVRRKWLTEFIERVYSVPLK